MDAIVGKFGDFLVSQGWVGLIVFACGFIIWRAWKQNDEIRAELKVSYDRYAELQDKRVADATANTISVVGTQKDVAASLDRLSEIIKVQRGGT